MLDPRFHGADLGQKNMDEKENRIYEFSYLLSPHTPEEGVPAEVGKLKDIIGNFGANFIAEEFPRLINLAYDMEVTIANKKYRFPNAYFGWFKFELGPDGILKLKDALKHYDVVIRHLLLKTVRENTMAPKRIGPKPEWRKRVGEKEKGAPAGGKEVEMNKEEVDKKIEELVA